MAVVRTRFSLRVRRGSLGHRLGRSVTVGVAAAAVVAGSATGVLAAPYSPPDVEVAVDDSLQPILHGEATATGSGTESMKFYARTVGASSWDLLNGSSVSGRDAFKQLPSGVLEIGEAFEYQIAHCDSTGCTSSAVETGHVSQAIGAGERPGATRLPFTLGDRLGGQVDVGSGNLLATMALFSLPRRAGSPLEVGLAYNSVTRRVEAQFDGSVGRPSSGWRLSTGSDVRLGPVPGQGAVVYRGPNGLTGTFMPKSGGGFTSPTGFKMTLTAVSGGGWKLNDHGSGDTRHFNAAGWMTQLEDRSGNDSTFSYNSSGALTQIVSDVGGAGAKTLTVTTVGSGRGRITEISQTADGYGGATRTVILAYDANGDLDSVTDQEGRVTDFVHGSQGNLNQIVAPGGIDSAFTYDNDGRVQTVTQPTADPNVDAVTRLLYEPGQTFVADPNSNQAQTPDVSAHTLYELTNDGWKLVDTATDPAGKERSATYTPFLDVASATDTSGTSTFGYTGNSGESLTSTSSPTGAGSSFAYGNTAQATRYQPTSGTDAQGNSSTFTYNGAGQRLSSADAGSSTASVTYNSDGTVATSTSPSGAVTDYDHNSVGQLTTITPPANTSLGQRTATWDGFGRLATLTDGRNITTTYSYDLLDRITEVDFSDATTDVTYAYDTAGRVDTRVDGTGTTSYDYDPLGRLTARSHTANTAGVSYSYDKVGNLASSTNAAGTTSYTYDVRNLVSAMTPADGRVIRFAYDDDGRRTDTWFHTNTARTTWAAHTHTDYDASGRITRTWTSKANPSSTGTDTSRVFDTSYTYTESTSGGDCPTATPGSPDSALRWLALDNLTGVYTNYCYDTANRLTQNDPGAGSTYLYDYDANGNRIETVKDGSVVQTQTVNAADQLTMTGYSYDAAGNLTADPNRGTATYNGAGQMTSFNDGAVSRSYGYAGTDQTELVTGPTNRSYTNGRPSPATGLPLVESYTSGSSTYSYLYDPNGTPLAITGGNAHYLALDALGSVAATINHSGSQTAKYTYGAWGETTITPVNGSGIGSLQLYTYAGGVTDTHSELVHLGMRWYDPATARFTQQDSIETLADPRRANRYEYAASNPINYVDPTGLDPFSDFLQGLGAAVVAVGSGAIAVATAPACVGIVTCGPTLVAGGTAIGSFGVAVEKFGDAFFGD